MPRPRFQFRLSTLLWITLAVACWFGGREAHRREGERELARRDEERMSLEERALESQLYISSLERDREYNAGVIKALTGMDRPFVP